jgi:hypothetical protein
MRGMLLVFCLKSRVGWGWGARRGGALFGLCD